MENNKKCRIEKNQQGINIRICYCGTEECKTLGKIPGYYLPKNIDNKFWQLLNNGFENNYTIKPKEDWEEDGISFNSIRQPRNSILGASLVIESMFPELSSKEINEKSLYLSEEFEKSRQDTLSSVVEKLKDACNRCRTERGLSRAIGNIIKELQ